MPSAPTTKPNSKSANPIAVRPRLISSHCISPNRFRFSDSSSRDCTAITNETAPNIPENPASFPRSPSTIPNSKRAPPIAAKPLPISSQSIFPNRFRFSDNSSRDCTAINIAAAPNIPENPASLPSRPTTTPNSKRAPPIAAKPRPISFHDIEPKRLRFSDTSSSDFDTIKIAVAPNNPENPDIFPRIAITNTISAKAPAIAVNPCPISPHDIVPIFFNASAMYPHDLASAIIAILVLTGTFTLSRILRATESSIREIPTPARPLINSSHDNSPIIAIDLDNILTASASNINANDDLIIPLEPNFSIVLFTFLNALNSIPNAIPIANKPCEISSTFNCPNFSIAETNSVTETAIANNAVVLIPTVNACKAL